MKGDPARTGFSTRFSEKLRTDQGTAWWAGQTGRNERRSPYCVLQMGLGRLLHGHENRPGLL